MRMSVLATLCLVVIAPYGRAQDSVAHPGSELTTVTVPAGGRLFARLERSISTRSAKPGDRVYLQIAHPVVVKNEIVIPVGTYVEATLDTIVGRGWINRRIELRLHVTSLVFANGYVVAAFDPMQGLSASNAGARSDGQSVSAASVTSISAPVAGTAIGAVSDGIRGAMVGGDIGSAIGAVAAMIAISGGSDVAMDAGSTLDLILQNSLTLDERRATTPAPVVVRALPRPDEHERRCYSPGMPPTPDIIIPGTPGTPAMGDIPATPPTPDIIVPGTPETAGYWHRCSLRHLRRASSERDKNHLESLLSTRASPAAAGGLIASAIPNAGIRGPPSCHRAFHTPANRDDCCHNHSSNERLAGDSGPRNTRRRVRGVAGCRCAGDAAAPTFRHVRYRAGWTKRLVSGCTGDGPGMGELYEGA